MWLQTRWTENYEVFFCTINYFASDFKLLNLRELVTLPTRDEFQHFQNKMYGNVTYKSGEASISITFQRAVKWSPPNFIDPSNNNDLNVIEMNTENTELYL